MPLDIREMLPPDAMGSGFDTVGSALNVSSVQMEAYLQALDVALDKATSLIEMPKTKPWHLSYLQTHSMMQVPPLRAEPRMTKIPKNKETGNQFAYDTKQEVGGVDLEQSLRVGYKAVLTSPGILYHGGASGVGFQRANGKTQARSLCHFELAERLAFFLWSSIPDAELLQAAASETLRDQVISRAQVNRMVRDVTSKLITYATGAPVSFADRAEVERIVEATRPEDHGFRSLIEAVVRSTLFQMK